MGNQVAVSDLLLFCVQHGRDHHTVSVFYLSAGSPGRRSGGHRVYVAPDSYEDLRRRIYPEPSGL